MLSVPLSAMLTIDCIPSSFTQKFPDGTSIHTILAAFLTHGEPALLKKWDSWRRVWPSRNDFEQSLPILWSESPNSMFYKMSPDGVVNLPPSVSGLWSSFQKAPVDIEYETRYTDMLSQQEKRLQSAWKSVRLVFPDTNWNAFSYNWLIFNTRSFFYVTAGKSAPEDWNDAIALVPFADYFNHEDEAVSLPLNLFQTQFYSI
jgi:SET domain